MKTKHKILIINGPNLQLLGKREVSIYGSLTLEDIERDLKLLADANDLELTFFQSCLEGEIVQVVGDTLLKKDFEGIIINPGAYSHTSIAIHDAIRAISIPVIEVHLSNIHGREEFRHTSITGQAAKAIICGFGAMSYQLALLGLINILNAK